MPRDFFPGVFRSILCPVDFSSNSRTALRYAAMLAHQSGGRLFVIYVNDPLLATAAATRHNAEAVLTSTENELRRFVTTIVRTRKPPVAATLLTVAGKPPNEIASAAERHGCDVIVMGYRGVGRTSRLLFGSTTEGVMKLSRVPVLAIPPARRRARLPIERARLRRAS